MATLPFFRPLFKICVVLNEFESVNSLRLVLIIACMKISILNFDGLHTEGIIVVIRPLLESVFLNTFMNCPLVCHQNFMFFLPFLMIGVANLVPPFNSFSVPLMTGLFMRLDIFLVMFSGLIDAGPLQFKLWSVSAKVHNLLAVTIIITGLVNLLFKSQLIAVFVGISLGFLFMIERLHDFR